MSNTAGRVAVIGAGLTGAAAAARLRTVGVDVVVFDKARGPGGRMSSKRVADSHLDFGAQYFTARTATFQMLTQQWLVDGSAMLWPFEPWLYDENGLQRSTDNEQRFIGTPGMHQVVRQLLADTKQHYQSRVVELHNCHVACSSQQTGQWTLKTDEGACYAGFDAVIITCPPEQSRQLLATCPLASPLAAQIPAGLLLPCWAVLLELTQAVAHPAEAIFIRSGALSWATRQAQKPGRGRLASAEHVGMFAEQWVVHLSAGASQQRLEQTPDQVAAVALQALSEVVNQPLQLAQSLCHRWLYASYNPAIAPPGLLQQGSLVLAGDWCFGGRVENAWLAGQQAAMRVLEATTPR